MKTSILIALLLCNCAGVSQEEASSFDVSIPDASQPSYCKVDADCASNETCVWQQIAVYNPNVPGGFSGECEPR
jgi:hypothetical protein